MTVRPLDYGDMHPSDSGDSVPSDPTAAFEERDFLVKAPDARGVSARPPVKASPDLRTRKVAPPSRVGYTAFVVKRETAKRYTVLRQDGRRISATIHGDDIVYDSLRIGEEVTLMEGQVPNQWQIHGRVRRKEMESTTLTSGADVEVTLNEKVIPFSNAIRQTGIDDDNDNITSDGETILVTKDIQGEYEVSINVHVTNTSQSTKKTLTVLMDARINDAKTFIEFRQMDIEVDTLTTPAWVNHIPLTSCGGY